MNTITTQLSHANSSHTNSSHTNSSHAYPMSDQNSTTSVPRSRSHVLRALTVATTLGLSSTLMVSYANANENRREANDGHYERSHAGYRIGKRQMTAQHPYAEAEMKTIANAMALRMLGPGSQANVNSGAQGSWQVALIDPKGNRVREIEMNAYGHPMRDQWHSQRGPRN